MKEMSRKIGYYILEFRAILNETPVKLPAQNILDLLAHVSSRNVETRIDDMTLKTKYQFLREYGQRKKGVATLAMSSGKYSFRPPLFDKHTAKERQNPKHLSEGEDCRTHFSLKPVGDRLLVIKEEYRAGCSINEFSRYLSIFSRKYAKIIGLVDGFQVKIYIVPKNDFLGELYKASRIIYGEVCMEKQVLGSEALNFSDRTAEVRGEISVSFKSVRGGSISKFIEDAYRKFRKKKLRITKVRAIAVDEHNRQFMLDTDLMKRIQYVDIKKDVLTGVVDSASALRQLKSIAENFDDI